MHLIIIFVSYLVGVTITPALCMQVFIQIFKFTLDYIFCNFSKGVGDGITYKLDRNKWRRVKNLHLAVGTCLLGELIKENVKFKTTDPLQPEKECEKYSLHVIDALRLGNVSLADLPLQERFVI